MRVLHLLNSDHYSAGGAISMNRLHSGLRKTGVDSRILCEKKSTASPYVEVIRPLPFVDKQIRRVTSRLGLNDVHRISSFGIKRHEAFAEADIIHIHGTHGGFINYLALPSLTRNKPAVFTLRDMWALTGHCAFSHDCERWKTGCGRCPYPDTYPSIRRDATGIEWKLKSWVYSRSNLTIVSPSSWLQEQARQSILRRFPVHWIPNAIDTSAYRPLDTEQCRSVIGIPKEKKVLLFSALELNSYRKGGDLLVKALQALPKALKAETLLLLLGNNGDSIVEAVGIEALDLGYVTSDTYRAIAYSAADLFVFPTRGESFGLVSIESMACGTPVVAFRVGGVPDPVRPGVTGYLAEPESSEDLCRGIVQLLENDPLRKEMSEQGRTIAVNEYDLSLHVRRHFELYKKVLGVDDQVAMSA